MGMFCAKADIGVAKGGAAGAPAPPRAVKVFSGPFFQAQFTGKCVSAPPGHEVHPQQSKSQFLGHFCWVA